MLSNREQLLTAAEPKTKSPSSSQIDFQSDIIPVLTKHGCNAGACHGAAIGRGGFKLSLYGGDPAADYASIVMQLNGRRINLSNSESSLLLLKPTEYVAHGGGTVFDANSDAAAKLKDWIDAGAPNASPRELSRLAVTPTRFIASSSDTSTPIRAVAHYSDGTKRDVTQWTIFKANDKSAVELTLDTPETSSSSTNSARVLRPGRHLVVARFLNQVVPLEFLLPFPGEAAASNRPEEPVGFIDAEVNETLETLNLSSASPANDAALIRRLYLDLT
ncbi:MAG: hypothetical protein AAGG44_19015, partial [Planctomycetota bacterium]